MTMPRDVIVIDKEQFDQLLTKDEFNKGLQQIATLLQAGAELSALYLEQAKAQVAAAETERKALGASQSVDTPGPASNQSDAAAKTS